MKGRLAAFGGIFCIALLIASGAYAGKPDKPDKPGKPPKPGNTAVECIEFTGDLESEPPGGTVVVGCCPNAGPAPAYRMTLVDVELIDDGAVVHTVDGTYDGHLFAKPVRTKIKGQTTLRYKVNFCTWDWGTEIPGEDDYFFEMYSDGDDIHYDETTDVLTVTFNNDHEDDTATVWVLHDVSDDCDDLSIYPYCDHPCADMEPACDPSIYDNCYNPCNEEFTDVNVSFIMTKTTDLSYCPGSGNIPPTASFTFGCTGLACHFTDASADSDGSVVDWNWDFGDGVTSDEQNPSYSYAAADTYAVILTVTDDGGTTDTDAQDVSVTGTNDEIILTATGYKVKGLQKADLGWSDATADVDVYRDGALVDTTENDGFYTDNIERRGGGSYIYKVCEENTTTCSNEATVNF